MELLTIIFTCFLIHVILSSPTVDEEYVKNFLKFASRKLSAAHDQVEVARWNFYLNLKDENGLRLTETLSQQASVRKTMRKRLLQFNKTTIEDKNILREIEILTEISNTILPRVKFEELSDLINDMTQIGNSLRVPDYHDPSKLLNLTDAKNIFLQTKNPAELKYLWKEIFGEVGSKILKLYPRYVQLKNEATKLLNYSNGTCLWDNIYEEPNLANIVENIIQQVMPLYKQMHAFTRFRLRQLYGALIPTEGQIPLHLVRDWNAANFQWLTRHILPYENRKNINPDILQGIKCKRIDVYKGGDDFYESLNLSQIPESFWEKSVFDRPTNEEVLCRPYVFHTLQDYRVLDCTTNTDFTSLPSVFLNLAEVQLYTQTEHQPFAFRTDLHPVTIYTLAAFAELSTTPIKYLTRILREKVDYNYQDFFNNLFYSALKTIPEIPNSWILNQWRLKVFSGDVKTDDYNVEWWKLVNNYLGIEAPMNRSYKNFDGALQDGLSCDCPIVDKIIGRVMAHQLHKDLCVKAGEYSSGDLTKPLHECSLYEQKFVGDLLTNGLRAGRSKRWSYMLEVVTGSDELDVGPLLEYFEPLHRWLERENVKNSEFIGWGRARTSVQVKIDYSF